MPTYYEILQIAPTASADEIEQLTKSTITIGDVW